jgi:hypothetical protein
VRPLIALPALIILAGCASSTAPAAPTPTVDRTYHDAKYHFSLQYPATWSASAPKTVSIQGAPTYTVNFSTPSKVAGVQIQVSRQVTPFPPFVEGHVAHDPNGPDMLHYHHLRASGWPAMQIERYSGTKVDGMFTIINTHTLSFTIEMVTPNPPFSAGATAGYKTMVRTIKLPFS